MNLGCTRLIVTAPAVIAKGWTIKLSLLRGQLREQRDKGAWGTTQQRKFYGRSVRRCEGRGAHRE